eukprot:138419-Hanusia_phi.AAC.1
MRIGGPGSDPIGPSDTVDPMMPHDSPTMMMFPGEPLPGPGPPGRRRRRGPGEAAPWHCPGARDKARPRQWPGPGPTVLAPLSLAGAGAGPGRTVRRARGRADESGARDDPIIR